MPNKLQHFVYISRLAPGQDPATVRSILEVSRERNRQRNLSGVLVFDGERFAQWLEGPPDQVLALAARLEVDPRHVEMRVLYAGVRAATERLASTWRAGYADPGDIDVLEDATDAPLDRFIALIPNFDLAV
jgi:Sensors of blue-light using FAD